MVVRKAKCVIMSLFLLAYVVVTNIISKHTVCYVEGCTLPANEAHGTRFCPIEILIKDLEERNIRITGLSDVGKREKLELVVHKEEEWQQIATCHRDKRFAFEAQPENFKLQLD
jgi:hypothetical protein